AQGEEPPPGGEVSSGAGSSSGRGFGISLPDPRTWVMVLSGLALLAVYGGYSWWRRRKKAA
ncbi:MAG: LPXTG cell wall anchor domain-containing protein, partial [Actinomycetota bacterium]